MMKDLPNPGIRPLDATPWHASISLCPGSPETNGLMNVIAYIEATSEDNALAGGKAVLELLTKGRETLLRTDPQARTQEDFETETKSYRGYVRFSFWDRPGPTHECVTHPEYHAITMLGLGKETGPLTGARNVPQTKD